MAPERSAAVAFGRALRALRTERSLTQDELALASGLQRKTISELEHAKVDPRLRTLRRLATALGVPAGDLLTLADELERRARRA